MTDKIFCYLNFENETIYKTALHVCKLNYLKNYFMFFNDFLTVNKRILKWLFYDQKREPCEFPLLMVTYFVRTPMFRFMFIY